MRSNSGSGKSNNNLRDPTIKEHEASRDKLGNRPAHGRAERAPNADEEEMEPSDSSSAG